MLSLPSELIRIDPLTGCKNFLGFLETGLNFSKTGIPSQLPLIQHMETSVGIGASYSAILFLEIKDMHFLNRTQGRSHGDSAIRWMGILLGEESGLPVYRLGGVEFAVYMNLESEAEYRLFLERILARMDRESRLLGFPGHAADFALILYDQPPTSLDNILLQMGEAMVRVKNSEEPCRAIFQATELTLSLRTPGQWKYEKEGDLPFTVRWLSRKNIYQVLELGRNLDMIQRDAYTDAISELPNMKAALLELDQRIKDAQSQQRCFSLLMIDGDNIRAYNNINYAAGDQLIRDMSAVFKAHLRPDDFIARWRSGDEFLVILPDTILKEAQDIAERLRLAVKGASRSWKFPTTISIGAASYLACADSPTSLIDQVEAANKRAKEQGKDQVVLAGEL